MPEPAVLFDDYAKQLRRELLDYELRLCEWSDERKKCIAKTQLTGIRERLYIHEASRVRRSKAAHAKLRDPRLLAEALADIDAEFITYRESQERLLNTIRRLFT